MNPSPRTAHHLVGLTLLLTCFLAAPAAADWLVLLDGKIIETEGTWELEGETLTYTDLEGQKQALAVDLVDLEGSKETTAMKQGLPYEPPPKMAPPPPAAPKVRQFPAIGHTDRPPVILYATSWCGYCRKARALLKDLDIEFVEKDIERDRVAAREMAQKAGGRSGVPVLDIGGHIVRGYSDRQIRRLVKDLQSAMAQAEEVGSEAR